MSGEEPFPNFLFLFDHQMIVQPRREPPNQSVGIVRFRERGPAQGNSLRNAPLVEQQIAKRDRQTMVPCSPCTLAKRSDRIVDPALLAKELRIDQICPGDCGVPLDLLRGQFERPLRVGISQSRDGAQFRLGTRRASLAQQLALRSLCKL
ncbi:MAG: hypothetical protein WDZ83_09010 [Rhizobiaceae bacterium]